ncbi:hypothetical protein CP974_05835 [Streptomyces fradiae ATCC 10745 = DSM 40063]|nr:hypothetical protein CP974_05835 [Streptomyces fradiae ATCC 10745 = DSM 40063]
MDFRPTGEPHCYDLYEEDEKIGELRYTPSDAVLEPYWSTELWSQMGTGKTWFTDIAESHEQAQRHALELYAELVAERRELNKGPRYRDISTPQGGQPRWRRR